jgi:hypothetical protein
MSSHPIVLLRWIERVCRKYDLGPSEERLDCFAEGKARLTQEMYERLHSTIRVVLKDTGIAHCPRTWAQEAALKKVKKEIAGYKEVMNSDAKKVNDTKNALIVKANEHGNFVYPGTNLIFKSNSEKYIVAKEGLHGEWKPLQREDIVQCKHKRLRYKIVDLTFKGEVR